MRSLVATVACVIATTTACFKSRGTSLCPSGAPRDSSMPCPDGGPASRGAGAVASRMVTVAPGVVLEVVDWGGRGQPLVFLAGLGSTAHVFDTFAPRFTDHFHAIGITRRGFGASAGALPPNSLDTLVADLTTVLDSLKLDKVVLVGHSIAGEEMTRFAELHGRRCDGLVYLDAAYDRARIDSIAARQPSVPGPEIRPEDTTSFIGMRALYARVLGVEEPESDIRATERFDSAGHYRGSVTSNALKARVTSGKQVARYDRAHCPALAIYAVPDSVVDVVPYYKELDVAGRAHAESLLAFVQSVVADSRRRVGRLPRYSIVDIHGSNHHLFLQRPGEVAAAMRTFLYRTRSPRVDSL
jgi:non-heme chloroperoxidase